MGTFISQMRHCAQVLVPETVYLSLAAVFNIFENGLCSLLAPWDITLPLMLLPPCA